MGTDWGGGHSGSRAEILPGVRDDPGSVDDQSMGSRVQWPKCRAGGEHSGRGMSSKKDTQPHSEPSGRGEGSHEESLRQAGGGRDAPRRRGGAGGCCPRPLAHLCTRPSGCLCLRFPSSACAQDPQRRPLSAPGTTVSLPGKGSEMKTPVPSPLSLWGQARGAFCTAERGAALGAYRSPAGESTR